MLMTKKNTVSLAGKLQIILLKNIQMVTSRSGAKNAELFTLQAILRGFSGWLFENKMRSQKEEWYTTTEVRSE